MKDVSTQKETSTVIEQNPSSAIHESKTVLGAEYGVDLTNGVDTSTLTDAKEGYYTPLEAQYGATVGSDRSAANMQTEEVLETPNVKAFPAADIREDIDTLIKDAYSYDASAKIISKSDNEKVMSSGNGMGISKRVYVPDPSATAAELLSW